MKHTQFRRVSRLRRGYHCKQVEAFLAKVEVSLTGVFPPMAAADIRRAGFELVHRGYAVDAVDAHLDRLEERMLTVQSAAGGRRGRSDPSNDAQFLRDELDLPYMKRFPRTGMLHRGYEVDEVDEFLDRVVATLSGAGDLTVETVRAAAFRPKRGGYDENAVDETLDRVVEVLLVQRRLGQPSLAVEDESPGDVEAAGPAV